MQLKVFRTSKAGYDHFLFIAHKMIVFSLTVNLRVEGDHPRTEIYFSFFSVSWPSHTA